MELPLETDDYSLLKRELRECVKEVGGKPPTYQEHWLLRQLVRACRCARKAKLEAAAAEVDVSGAKAHERRRDTSQNSEVKLYDDRDPGERPQPHASSKELGKLYDDDDWDLAPKLPGDRRSPRASSKKLEEFHGARDLSDRPPPHGRGKKPLRLYENDDWDHLPPKLDGARDPGDMKKLQELYDKADWDHLPQKLDDARQETLKKPDAASIEKALWARYQKLCIKPKNTKLNPSAVATWEAKFEKYKENYRSRPLAQIENYATHFS